DDRGTRATEPSGRGRVALGVGIVPWRILQVPHEQRDQRAPVSRRDQHLADRRGGTRRLVCPRPGGAEVRVVIDRDLDQKAVLAPVSVDLDPGLLLQRRPPPRREYAAESEVVD